MGGNWLVLAMGDKSTLTGMRGGGVHFTSWEFSTSWKFNLHIVFIFKKT